MEEEVLLFIDKHKLIKGPATVLVGVSGGPDSMALLYFLNRYKSRFNIDLIALSIDHQLRGEESQADNEYVKEQCNHWNIPFIEVDVDVKSYIKKYKLSQQTASRKARYDAYKEALTNTNAKYLALGHHADDQVETMLMALTKVTSPEVLSGIPLKRPLKESEIIRPLLSVNKQMIEAYCKQNKINPRYDISNEDLDYERNYFREKIVPLLQDINPNIYKTAQIMSENLQEDHKYLEREAKKTFDTLIIKENNGQLIKLNRVLFQRIPKPLQRRVYKLTLDYLYKNKNSILSYEHEAIFMQLVNEQKANYVLDFPQSLKVEKAYDMILFYFKEIKKSEMFYPRQINIGETLELKNQKKISSSLVNDHIDLKTDDPNIYYCEKNSVELPLKIRNRRPGDRITWEGLNGSKKIKDILIDKKIPRTKRDELLIVTDNKDEILWLIGFVKGLPKKAQGKPPYIKLELSGLNSGGTYEK